MGLSGILVIILRERWRICMFLASVERGEGTQRRTGERKKGGRGKEKGLLLLRSLLFQGQKAPSLLEPTVATSTQEKRRGRRPMKPFLLFPRLASSYPPSFLGQTKRERERNGLFLFPSLFPLFTFFLGGSDERTFLSLFPFSSDRCRSSLWASVGCSGEGGREANWAEAAAGQC